MKKLVFLLLTLASLLSLASCDKILDMISPPETEQEGVGGGAPEETNPDKGETVKPEGGTTDKNEGDPDPSDLSLTSDYFDVYGDVIMYREKLISSEAYFVFDNKLSHASTSTLTIEPISPPGNQRPLSNPNGNTFMIEEGENKWRVTLTDQYGNSVEYTATVYRKHLYTVSFDTMGGSAVEPVNVQEDNLPVCRSTPFKFGYTFEGWSSEFYTPAQSDLTVTAIWKPNLYLIQYYDADVTSDMPTSYTVEDAVTLPTPEKPYNTFLGWKNEKSGEIITEIPKGSIGDLELRAVWQQDKYVLDLHFEDAELYVWDFEAQAGVTYQDSAKIALSYSGDEEFLRIPPDWQPAYIPHTSTFLGWAYGAPSGEIIETVSREMLPEAGGEISLYAVFERNLGELIFTLSDDGTHYIITGTNGGYDSLYIPSVYKEKPVSIAPEAICNSSATSITVEEGITEIPARAFADCWLLETVSLPSSLVKIADDAFVGCTYLTYNYSIGTVRYLGNENNNYLVLFDGSEYMDSSIVIPAETKFIFPGAFENSTTLTEVSFEADSSLLGIGAAAFDTDCEITYFDLPLTVTHLGERSIQMNEAYMTERAPGLFYLGHWLMSCIRPYSESGEYVATLAADTMGIYPTALYYTEAHAYVIDEASTYFKTLDGVLYNNDMTTLIKYPTLKADTTFAVPDSVTEIENCAFYYALNLRTLSEISSVEYIGNQAFYGCMRLWDTGITESSPIVHIGDRAYYECPDLLTLTLPTAIESTGGYILSNNGFLEIYNTAGFGLEGVIEYGYTEHTSLTAPSIFIYDGDFVYLTVADTVTMVSYRGDGVGALTLPSTLLGESVRYALRAYLLKCEMGITEITVPAAVSTVGAYAFSECYALKKLVIEEGVSALEAGIFSASPIEYLYLPESIESFSSHEYSASVTGLSHVKELYIPAELLRSKIIGLNIEKLVIIGEGTVAANILYESFYDGHLDVYISDSVTAIAEDAFRLPGGSRTFTIYYEGDTTAWESICESGWINDSGSSALTGIYYNQTIE